MVAGAILANASSTGANTVNSPPLRVSTRFTSGLSLPDRADVRVVNIGLFEAATATGSCAMPMTEAGPVGFFAAYPAHPGPTSPAAGSACATPVDEANSPAAASAATATPVIVFLVF